MTPAQAVAATSRPKPAGQPRGAAGPPSQRRCGGVRRLVGRTQRLVDGYLLRCGVERAAGDDLFQEIFVGVHAAAAARRRRPLKPWLLSIVANTVRSHDRRSRRHDTALASGRLVEDRAALPDGQQLAEAARPSPGSSAPSPRRPWRSARWWCCAASSSCRRTRSQPPSPCRGTGQDRPQTGRLTLAQGLARRTAALRREVP